MLLHFLLLWFLCFQAVVQSRRPVLREIQYFTSVSSRFAQTEMIAVFNNPRKRSTRKSLSFVLPGNCLLNHISLVSSERNVTGFIVPRLSRKRSKSSRKPDIYLQRRDSNSQQLKMRISLKPGEQTSLNLKYVELLQRRRGLYHLVYFRSKKDRVETTISISIKDAIALRNISFLSAHGDTMHIKKVSSGIVETRFSSPTEFHLKYITGNSSPLRHVQNADSSDAALNPSGQVDLLLKDPAYIFSYDINRESNGGDLQIQNGYFAHFFAPEGLPKLPLHTVFVLDISGSMVKLKKMRSLQTAMDDILHSLSHQDSFEIVLLSTAVVSLGAHKATPKNVSQNVKKIYLLRPYGGTNIHDALIEALNGAKNFKQKLGAKQIVFLTDGVATVGETNPHVIRRNVRSANEDNFPIYSLAFGNDADLKFLKKVSHENNAFSRKIDTNENPAIQLKRFYEEISQPLVADIEVLYDGSQVELPSTVREGGDQFYSGKEIIMAGKIKAGATSVVPIIQGTSFNGRTQLRIARKDILPPPTHNGKGELERLWAYLAIKDLLEGQEHIEDRTIRNEMRSRALEIAIEYNYVTPLTPFSLIDTSLTLTGPEYLTAAREGQSTAPAKDLALLSTEDFMATLPKELHDSMSPSQSRRYSFGADNDPHFVVYLPSIPLPVCFDLHGKHGQVFQLLKDQGAGVVINGEVNTTPDRPKATHFTRISIHILYFNLTITTDGLSLNCANNTKHYIEADVRPTCKDSHKRKRKRSSCETEDNYRQILDEMLSENNGCQKVFKWFDGLHITYGEFSLIIRGTRKRKKLEITMGDVALHVVITNTRMKNGNSFLGIYIQNHKILSPSTSGVIGQFLYKSVGIIGHFPKLLTHPLSQENRLIPLAVVHTNSIPEVPRVTEVLSVVSRRNSLLHRGKILCLHVKRQGQGLLDKKPHQYVTPCLYC